MERRYLNSALLEGVVLQNPMTISPESAGNLIVRFDVECDNSRPSADGKRVDDSATVPVIAIGDFGKEVLNVIRADHVEFMRDGVRVVIDGSDV